MKYSKKLLYLFLFFSNYLYGIGDGPRIEESHIIIILGVLVLILIVFIYLVNKFKAFRKLLKYLGILSIVVLGCLYLGNEYLRYKDIDKYKDFFCKETKNSKDRIYIDNLIKFKKINDSQKDNGNIFLTLTNTNKKIITCMNKNNSKNINTLNNAAVEFLINKDYKKSKDIFYELSKNGNKEAAYYYYNLSGDACYFYYHKNNTKEKFEKICKNRPLKIKQDKNIDFYLFNLLKNNNQNRFNIEQYYVIDKKHKELSSHILRYPEDKKGYDKAIYSVYTDKNELIKEGLSNSNGEIFFNHKKGTIYYMITFNLNTRILMSVIELEKSN